MIVIQLDKSSSPPFKTGSTIVRYFKMAQKSQPRSPSTMLPPLPFEALAWQVPPDKFPSRTVRLLSRHVSDLHCESLGEHVYKISELLANNLQSSVTDAELRSLWQEGFMVAGNDCRIPLSTFRPHTLRPGRPRLVKESLDESVAQFCLTRQHDRAPAAMSGIIDFLSTQGVTGTDFGSETLFNGKSNDCLFRSPRSSTKTGTMCHVTTSDNASRP
jgi:hypothetical protein